MLPRHHIEFVCKFHRELYVALLAVVATDRNQNPHSILADEVVKHRRDAAKLGAARTTELMDALWDHGREGYEKKMKSFLTE